VGQVIDVPADVARVRRAAGTAVAADPVSIAATAAIVEARLDVAVTATCEPAFWRRLDWRKQDNAVELLPLTAADSLVYRYVDDIPAALHMWWLTDVRRKREEIRKQVIADIRQHYAR
jgi:hypothetical protein